MDYDEEADVGPGTVLGDLLGPDLLLESRTRAAADLEAAMAKVTQTAGESAPVARLYQRLLDGFDAWQTQSPRYAAGPYEVALLLLLAVTRTGQWQSQTDSSDDGSDRRVRRRADPGSQDEAGGGDESFPDEATAKEMVAEIETWYDKKDIHSLWRQRAPARVIDALLGRCLGSVQPGPGTPVDGFPFHVVRLLATAYHFTAWCTWYARVQVLEPEGAGEAADPSATEPEGKEGARPRLVAALPNSVAALLKSPTEPVRSLAQVLTLSMLAPPSVVAVTRRFTADAAQDAWACLDARPMDKQTTALSDAFNYCKFNYDGSRWMTDEDRKQRTASEIAEVVCVSISDSVMEGPILPIQALGRARIETEKRIKEARKVVPPSEETKRVHEDAWILAAWVNGMDTALSMAGVSKRSTQRHSAFMAQCVVLPHEMGTSESSAKLTVEPWEDVDRLPVVIIRQNRSYALACGECDGARANPRLPLRSFADAKSIVSAWFECVRTCRGGRDGYFNVVPMD
jgi:hypothetical protein